MDTETLGQRMRRLRRARGMTQAEAEAAAGLGADTLARYEQDRRHPPFRVIEGLARAFGVKADVFTGCKSPDAAEAIVDRKDGRNG